MLMVILLIVLLGWILVAGVMVITWHFSRVHGKAAIVDVVWTLSLALLCFVYAVLLPEGVVWRKVWVTVLVTVWAVRLGGHLWKRVRSEPEDRRYAALKEQWGAQADVRMFKFFQYQAVGAVLLSSAFMVALMNPVAHFTVWDALAFLIALGSIYGEGMADRQLRQFKHQGGGAGQRVCRIGLWNYSRHPNYFFEWTYWLAFPLMAVGSDLWLLACVSPALLYYFITRVTGIPPTEAHLLRSRGEEYRQYQKEVSAFFPWKPK